MKINSVKKNILNFLGKLLISPGVSLLCKTLDIKIKNEEVINELILNRKNFVVAFWHGTMLVPWFVSRRNKMVALISQSKDGDLLSKLLENWNYKVVRGSSSSGGENALEMLLDLAAQGNSVAITPDGPRGPGNEFKAGAVIIAKKSGIPLVMMGAGYKSKKVLKSWDKFQVPYFFSIVNIVYSDPIFIDAGLNYAQTSEMITKCGELLNELQTRAGKFN